MSLLSLSDDIIIEIFKKLECQQTILNLRQVCKRTRNLVDYVPLINYEKRLSLSGYELGRLKKINFNIIYRNIEIITFVKELEIPNYLWNSIKEIDITGFEIFTLEKIQLEKYANLEIFSVTGFNYKIDKNLNIKTLIVKGNVNIISKQTYIENLKLDTTFPFKINKFLSLKKVIINDSLNTNIINLLPDLEYLEIHKNYQETTQYRAKHLSVNNINIDLNKCQKVELLELRLTKIVEVTNLKNLQKLSILGAYHNSNYLLISDLPFLEDLSLYRLKISQDNNINSDIDIDIRNVPKLRNLYIDARLILKISV